MGVVYRNKARRAMSGIPTHRSGKSKTIVSDVERHWTRISGEEQPIAGGSLAILEMQLAQLPKP